MPYNWGPRFIVPSDVLKTYSGVVLLREEFDDSLLHKELEELGITGSILRVNNPWYYRKKNTDTWIGIGESDDRQQSFPVKWDTTALENGQYEVMGLMHVVVGKHGMEQIVARGNVVEVSVEN